MKKRNSEKCEIYDILMEIKYKLGKIEEKINQHEKIIYVVLTGIITLLIKVFLL